MKAMSKILTVVMLIAMLVACAPTPTAVPQATDAPKATLVPTDVPLTPQEEWLKANSLGQYDTGEQDWAAIEAAAKVEGTVLVYANSSKIEKAAETFMELYPEIKVEGYDLGGDDVYLKTVEEQKAGAFTGDVWFSSGGPNIKGELIPKGYLWRFVPAELVDVVPVGLDVCPVVKRVVRNVHHGGSADVLDKLGPVLCVHRDLHFLDHGVNCCIRVPCRVRAGRVDCNVGFAVEEVPEV